MDITSIEMHSTLARAMTNVEVEHTDVPLPVAGTLPPGLDGVLFRNGPGRFERGGCRYAHPFDGDGHVVRLALGPDGVRYTNRFVRTVQYRAEELAGRMRYRGFGTNLPGGLFANLLRGTFKNAANTHVVWQGGRLLALWEGGLPHRLDPHTLATLGSEDFQGRLRNRLAWPERWLVPLLPFAAHPRVDADTGELIGFGIMFGTTNRLLIYRVGADGRMAKPEAHELPRCSFVHDFAVTRRWLCFLLPYAELHVPSALLGMKTLVGSLELAPERPIQALLIPRDPASGQSARIVDTVPGFVFHIAQGFDGEDGSVILDAIRFRDLPGFDDFDALFDEGQPSSGSRLERFVIEPDQGRCTVRPWSDRPSEMPTAAPGALGARQRILYSVGAPPERTAPYFTALHRLDTETGELRFRDLAPDLPGEPIVALAADGEPWLLSLVYRTAECRTDLTVLRAADLSVQATVPLPHAVPPGYHGCWVERSALG